MSSTQILQWSLWGLSLFAGVGAILALFKLRDAERYLPKWTELTEIDAVLTVRREELRQVTEGVEKRHAEIGQLEATVGNLRILKEWQDANPEAPARIQQMMIDLERCKSELAAVQQKLAQEEQFLKAAIQENDKLKEDRIRLTQETKALGEKFEGLQKQKAEVEKTIQDLDGHQRDLQRQVNDLLDKQFVAEKELAELTDQVAAAQKEKRDAEAGRDEAFAERNAALAEKAGIEKAIEQLRDLAKGMQSNLKDAGVTGGGNYQDLSKGISFPPLAPTSQPISEQLAVERAQKYISGKKLVFPERIIHAFHTSLKTGDICPLVVLAGISGTGKSELPRHYADGMGFHFLLSAVQPRWDSPQDLFGFYNYLERRYKATELARALVQFERFNQKAFEEVFEDSDIDNRSDRMLLVLLDEMNLARTEYYFSEFLSKLETRRMVNENVEADRGRAEIELDMGGTSKDGNRGLRIYPGKNVLFVGTMNEDESTQSLSDKVIDRATVLRFGRPKKTNPQMSGGQESPVKNGLTFQQWEGWLQKPEDLNNHAHAVDDWIDKLNDALDRLGRPFAFRVDRSIRSYIANYPRWVTEWHKRAMADQIEQRIFPKLRGIEPDQGEAPHAFNVISSIIDELEDEPLKQAFQKSYRDQSTFLFRGVVRE
ncbi:MAG TPA: AAA family ATPase [Verrucomicrobiae bacterium]|jgi:hypothetical protein|nr:AAA family ATPase [Verrucomicrobiae bacterium]